jgi:hypothetical protein
VPAANPLTVVLVAVADNEATSDSSNREKYSRRSGPVAFSDVVAEHSRWRRKSIQRSSALGHECSSSMSLNRNP